MRSRLMPEVRSRLMPEEVREVRVGYGCAGAALVLRWCCTRGTDPCRMLCRGGLCSWCVHGAPLGWCRGRGRCSWGAWCCRRAGAAFAAFAAFAAAVAAGGAFGGATLCCCGSCGRADRQDKSSELEFPVLDFRSGFAVFTVLKQPAEKHAGGGDGGMKE